MGEGLIRGDGAWLEEEVGLEEELEGELEEELEEEREEKLDELVTQVVAQGVAQVVEQMMALIVAVKEVPAEGGKGNGVQVWEAATLASRENLGAGDEERAVDEGIPGEEGETIVDWRFSTRSSCRSTYLRSTTEEGDTSAQAATLSRTLKRT